MKKRFEVVIFTLGGAYTECSFDTRAEAQEYIDKKELEMIRAGVVAEIKELD